MTELICKSDALHAVLHNTGDAAVAAVQNIKPINPHGELREMLIDDMIDRANRPNNNAELIKALRACSKVCCAECPYEDKESCPSTVDMMHTAADALEAADKRIADLEKSYSWKAYAALEESIEGYKTRIAELEAQLPKEGEWIVEEIDDCGYKWCKWRCSVCREVVQKGWMQTKDGEKPKWKHCPNCGAKMRGEQDGSH